MPKIFFRRQNHSFKKIFFLAEFRVSHPCMPDPVTGICRRLAELKVITCCSSRYQVRGRQKAVDRRAGLLMAEYRRKERTSTEESSELEMGLSGPLRENSQNTEISSDLWLEPGVNAPRTCTPLSRCSQSPGWTPWVGRGAGQPRTGSLPWLWDR